MGRTRSSTTLAISGLLILLASGRGSAAEPGETEGKKPDATVRFTVKSVGLGIGTSWGSGTLDYKGKSYPFKVQGLSAGDVGAASVEATGEVFNLARLEDFSGNYSSVGAGAAVGGGAGASMMRNQSGVVMQVTSTSQGAQVKAGVSGVKVQLQDAKAEGQDDESTSGRSRP